MQWHEVLLAEIEAVLARKPVSGRASAIRNSFYAQIRRLMAETPQRSYDKILHAGFTAAFGEHGVPINTMEIDRIASSPTRVGPHPEVPHALRRLKECYKLAIITNSDDDLIAPTVGRIGVLFDYVFTAQQAGAYKPSLQLFEYAYRMMGVAPVETVHVAMGMYTDMKTRHEMGLRAIWVNRRNEQPNSDWRPYA